MVWVSSRQEAYWPLRWFLSVIKTQKTVMTRIDVGLPGSLHGSALPPCQHLSESPTLSFGQHTQDRRFREPLGEKNGG